MAPTSHTPSGSPACPYKALSVQTSSSSTEWKRSHMKDKKRQRRGAIMCSTDDSLECVMAAMMHSDLLSSCDDDDWSVESEGGKRRRSSALSSLASKHSDSSPRGSLTGTDNTVLFLKDSASGPAVEFSFSLPTKSEATSICATVFKGSFSLESLGEGISRNLVDMKQIAPFSLELPIFEGIPSTVNSGNQDESCGLSTFFPSRR